MNCASDAFLMPTGLYTSLLLLNSFHLFLLLIAHNLLFFCPVIPSEISNFLLKNISLFSSAFYFLNLFLNYLFNLDLLFITFLHVKHFWERT